MDNELRNVRHKFEGRSDAIEVCKWCDRFPDDPVHKSLFEEINHPDHYNQHPAGIECIDVIEHMSFPIGNVIKHLWRAGLKPGMSEGKDLMKAHWYLTREIQRIALNSPEVEEEAGRKGILSLYKRGS